MEFMFILVLDLMGFIQKYFIYKEVMDSDSVRTPYNETNKICYDTNGAEY